MQETPQDYTARILANVDGKDPISIQRATPRVIRDLLQSALPERLTYKPDPDKWSAGEILAHMAETEIVFGFRVRYVLGASGAAVPAYDQDVWARNSHYERMDPMKSLEVFTQLRQFNVALFETLPPEMMEYYGVHAERGKETVDRMFHMMAGHDINHIRQLQKLLT